MSVYHKTRNVYSKRFWFFIKNRLGEYCSEIEDNNLDRLPSINLHPLNLTSPAPVLANKERIIEPKIRHPTKLKLPIRFANKASPLNDKIRYNYSA